MTNERLFELLGDIDESYVTEEHSKIGLLPKMTAACLCVFVVGLAIFALTNVKIREKLPDPATYSSPVISAGDTVTHSGGTVISFYGGGSADMDMAVENGVCVLSDSLKNALEHYGDEGIYRVAVELFSDGTEVAADSTAARAEEDRLFGEGLTVAVETCCDGYVTRTVMTLHAKREQLEIFPAGKDFGYHIMLYDEFFGQTDTAENAPIPTTSYLCLGEEFRLSDGEGYAFVNGNIDRIEDSLQCSHLRISSHGYGHMNVSDDKYSLAVNVRDYLLYSDGKLVSIATVMKDEEGTKYYLMCGAPWFDGYAMSLSEHAGQELVFLYYNNKEFFIAPDGAVFSPMGVELDTSAQLGEKYDLFRCEENTFVPEEQNDR